MGQTSVDPARVWQRKLYDQEERAWALRQGSSSLQQARVRMQARAGLRRPLQAMCGRLVGRAELNLAACGPARRRRALQRSWPGLRWRRVQVLRLG